MAPVAGSRLLLKTNLVDVAADASGRVVTHACACHVMLL